MAKEKRFLSLLFSWRGERFLVSSVAGFITKVPL